MHVTQHPTHRTGPIRHDAANDPLRMLMTDHREIECLLEQLAASPIGSYRLRTVKELTRTLTLHMEIEEWLVYPMLREHVGDAREEEADVEHELIREQLGRLAALADAPGFATAVGMLAGGLHHHVVVEEHELLPELLSQLQPSERRALGDAVARARASADPTGGSVRQPTDLPIANAFCLSH